MKMPVVSITCLVYNHENYIEQALEGFLMQKTSFSYEIIIHDDASTDNSLKIINEYASKYPDLIKVLHQNENQYSKGIKPWVKYIYPECKGKYIAFCEGDDYWTDPFKLQKQVDILEAHPEYSICFHETKDVWDDGRIGFHNNISHDYLFNIKDLTQSNFIASASCLFRNNLIEKFPPWFSSIKTGDWALFFLIAQFGDIYYLKDCMVVYRKHLSGIWSGLPYEKVLIEGVRAMIAIDEGTNYKYHEEFQKGINLRLKKGNQKEFNVLLAEEVDLNMKLKNYLLSPDSDEKKLAIRHSSPNQVLAIVCPKVGVVSETFIRKHYENLAPSKTVILTGQVLDESWFQGPVKIIPIELGAYSFDYGLEKEVIKFFEQNSVTHILCEFGCIGGSVVELNNRVMKLPIYVHFHGQDASEFIRQPEIAEYYRWMGGVVDGVIAVSKPMSQRLIDVGIPKEKIKIIHYGVDYNNECKVKPEKNPCRFVSVSRLVGKKGIQYVLQAFEKTQKEVPDVTLDIIGEGPLRSEIEKFISEHNLSGSVKLHGEQSHEYVLNMMDQSSVFVQHSLVDPETGNREGLPLSILEASAHGLPVISTFHEGIPEAIEHDYSGLLVEEKDWTAMAVYMIKLAKDGVLRKQMGIAGREKISNEDFTVNVMLNNLRSFMGLEKEINYSAQGNTSKIASALKRVLFVNHSLYPFEISGTPISTFNHAIGIKNKGVKVGVLFPSDDVLNGFSKEENENYTIYKVPRLDKYETFLGDVTQFIFNKYISSIEKILYDFKPDLVHINDYVFMPEQVVSVLSKSGAYIVRNVCNLEEICFLDFPVYRNGDKGVLCSGPESSNKCAECFLRNILKIENDDIDKTKIEKYSKKIERRFNAISALYKEHVDGLIFTEKSFGNYFKQFVDTSKSITKINPRGFQFSQIRKKSTPKKHSEIIHIGYIGRLSPEKGFDLVLKSFEEICHLENFVLDIYSSGSIPVYRNEVKKLEEKYPNKIKFHGKYDNADFQQIADSLHFALVPSRFDTFNRIIRELMYFGVPVITADFFGASIIENDKNGIKIPVEDYDALTSSIAKLLQNPAQIEKLSEGALNTPIASLDDEINGIYDFYKQILSENKKTKTEIIPSYTKYTVDITEVEKLFSQKEYLQSYLLLDELKEKEGAAERLDVLFTNFKRIFDNSIYNKEIVFGNIESPATNVEFMDSFTAHGWVISPVVENIEILILINEKPFLPNRAYRGDVADVYKLHAELNTKPGFALNVSKEYLTEGINSFVCYANYKGDVIKVVEQKFTFNSGINMGCGQKPEINEQELILLAEEKIQEDKFEEAQFLLNQILYDVNPNSVDALNDLAVICILESNFQNALEYLNKVLSHDPQNELALNNILFIKQKFEEIKNEFGISPEAAKDLSIIIPVFNKKELTINCLRSLNSIQSTVKFEVVVVDNASSDGTKEEIEKLKQQLNYEITYLRNETNLGFAKANNIGSQTAKFNNLLFLNNDTLANTDFLTKPIEYLNNQKVGVVGIKLLYADNLVQHAGIVFNHLKQPEHIFKFYKSDHPAVNMVSEMQSVTGACMFIRKNIFESLGGFDESYINGWEDTDLCFKVRDNGLKVIYMGEVFIYHLESQSDGRLNYAKENEKLFFSRWFNKVEIDSGKYYKQVRTINSPKSFGRKYDLPHKLNFAIKIGVPSREEKGWGDIYYAESLSRAIHKAGHNCVIHYLNEWDQSDEQINIVIHLKGLSAYKLKPNNINVIWVINHPELHTVEELNQYDLVLCASEKYYNHIKDKLSVSCLYLPQATDEDVFNESSVVESKDIDLLFVGNNYEYKNNKCRSIIDEIIKSGKNYSLHIIGKYWEGYIPAKYIKGEFVEWSDLPSLYGRAKIVLNDHQETMRDNGFINNRTFDLALMPAFQISNYVEGMDELGIVSYKTTDELIQKIDYFLDHENERIIKAQEVKEKCKAYTFNQHAEAIVKLLNEISSTKSVYTKCNICGHEGDDFLAMGSRQKVRCPECSSLERQRALWFLLQRDNLIKPGMKVLEIAPLNNKIYRQYFEEAGCEYVCIDKWKHGNPLDKRDTSWIDYEMDVCDLKFEDNTFDLVLMQHVIEEVPDDMKAFSEIARVTKKEGFALLEVPHNKNLRKTIEYGEPQKFGNLRQYGVDFYAKIKDFFAYREEVIVDGVSFSKLGKKERECKLNFPIILDHPAFDNEKFVSRFNNILEHFKEAGFISLTSAQVNNLVHQNVNYKHPYWITFDDGSVEDIAKAYPILKKNDLHATSFLIPERIDETTFAKWKSIIGNPFLDIQNHSANHNQCFISSKLVGVFNGQQKYSNLMEKIEEYGYPVFEYASCIKHKRFIPHQNIIDACLQYYKNNFNNNEDEYIEKLSKYLVDRFGSNIGTLEDDSMYKDRIEVEINESWKKLNSQFGADIFAFSFPWGLYSEDALEKCRENHSLGVCVNPKRINHEYKPYELERVEITGSALPLLVNSLYTTNPWEKYEYKNEPAVAVLMTTYNRQDLVADAIQSVINQTYKDWNLVVVNDGGDDISELVNSFNDPRIKYFNVEHRGKAAALNFAIQNSKSKYIAYLDDDDAYYPNHLEALISYLETHPEHEFAYSISREVEKIFSQTGWKTTQNAIRYARQVTPVMLRFMNHIPNLCAVHTRRLFENAGLYDETLNVLIDWDMYRKLAVYAPPIFVGIVTSEYTKRTYLSTQEKQITGLFYKDPVKYYQYRLKVLNKNYPKSERFISNKNCVIIICNENNIKSIPYLIYKIDMLQKDQSFEVVLVCDMKLGQGVVEIIMAAEGKNVLARLNENPNKSDQFISDILEQNAWEKIVLVDDVAKFNNENLRAAFNQKQRVVNFSKYLKNNYLPEKSKAEKENELASLKVSVIIPTYNNWGYTQKCLKSLLDENKNKTKFDVIVVDNFSGDETREKIKSYLTKHSNLKLILNDKNYGFAVANNIGAKSTDADYLLFLNNDTVVSGDWLDKMVLCSLNEEVGIVGAKLLYPDKTIQHAGIAITEYQNQLVAYHLFPKENENIIYANVYRNFQAVTGACLLIKKELFNNVGAFDEGYLNGYEDVDLCFKVAEKGYKTRYCPETNIIHYESKTAGRFENVSANSKRLNEKWKNKIKPDDVNQLLAPVVSIVIPVYNQLEYTKKCLDSIRLFTTVPYEVIVVNDGSTDETSEYLATQKDLIVKTNDRNYGYPISCNVGIRAAGNKHVLILNNDTLVTEKWLEHLLDVFDNQPKTGLVGPVSNLISGFQFDSEAKYSSIPAMYTYAKTIYEKRKCSWMPAPRIAFVCVLMHKDLIEKIGGLDERFSPGNFEDDDFCLRAQLAGYKTIIAQDVFIHHYGSKSFKANGAEQYAKRLEHNKQVFINKWGADPEEIWLRGKTFQKRNPLIPIDANFFSESMKRAMVYLNDKDFEQALIYLNESIDNYDKYSRVGYEQLELTDILNLAGNTALMNGDFEQAQQYFEKELQANPASSRACAGLAEVFFAVENYEAAKTMFEWSLKHNPDFTNARNGLKKVNGILQLEEEHNTLEG